MSHGQEVIQKFCMPLEYMQPNREADQVGEKMQNFFMPLGLAQRVKEWVVYEKGRVMS